MMNQSAQPGEGQGTGRGWGNSVERLEGYRLALELATVAPALVPRGHAALRDQIDRAAASVVLTLAEGWGRWQPREKAHFYNIARGSALEVAAGVDVIEARGLAPHEAYVSARALADRLARILTGLIRSVERRGRG
jgi:four helix bundle protein